MNKYKVKVLKSANEDLQDAIEYYETQKEGLGLQFFGEYEKTEDRISENPYLYEKHDESFRKANLNKFPYSAYYEVEEPTQEVTINGVIHQSRNPQLIKDKLQKSKK